MSGEIIEVNQAVVGDPSLVNREPYAGGWFVKIRLSTPAELETLLGADQYRAQIGGA